MFENIQEREERDFNRMGPAEEMRWQHAQGMRCSFDCAACDPYDHYDPSDDPDPVPPFGADDAFDPWAPAPATAATHQEGPTMASTTVTVFHNVERDEVGRPIGMLDGYRPGHPLTLVYRYVTDRAADHALLEAVFEQFNIGEDLFAGEYRAAGNRSLSVGDVVSLTADGETTWHAVASMGYDELPAPPTTFSTVTRFGTTPRPSCCAA